MPNVICQRENCNNEYYVKSYRIKRGGGKYCSKECYRIDQKAKTKAKVNTVCARDECNNEYYVIPSKKKKGLDKFCSHECYGLDKRGKPLSEEHKKKIGEATKKMWEDGVFDAPHIREAYAEQGRSTRGSKRTPEQRKAMSEARKGKDVSQLHTPEARAKALESRKGYKQTPESNKKRSETLKGRKFTDDHRENLSKAGKGKHGGESNPNWKGGTSKKEYPDEFTPYLKKKVRKRDKQLCRVCGKLAKGRDGRIHHIDGNKQNCEMENLVLVCFNCHHDIHLRKDGNDPVILAFRSMLNS